jgi:hypothetical protein
VKTNAEFRSPWAVKYFETMVKHFSQKIEVQKTDAGAHLLFVCGTADLTLSENRIVIDITAPHTAALEMTCDVVERHLLRFAFREAPEPLAWTTVSEV